MQLVLQQYWDVTLNNNEEWSIPVDIAAKKMVEDAMGNPACEVVYFIDIFGAEHIIMCSAISHLEFSTPEIRRKRSEHFGIIYAQYHQDYNGAIDIVERYKPNQPSNDTVR
jgi:hypothetical protein